MKAKKINMTQIFGETGEVFPVTVVVPIDASSEVTFKNGDVVTVSGTSKGKGDKRSHGRKHSERTPGSIGGGGRAGGRVIKGMRMAGRMGGERVTVKNLKIIKVIPETGELYIRGAIPGRRGSKVEILSTKS